MTRQQGRGRPRSPSVHLSFSLNGAGGPARNADAKAARGPRSGLHGHRGDRGGEGHRETKIGGPGRTKETPAGLSHRGGRAHGPGSPSSCPGKIPCPGQQGDDDGGLGSQT